MIMTMVIAMKQIYTDFHQNPALELVAPVAGEAAGAAARVSGAAGAAGAAQVHLI